MNLWRWIGVFVFVAAVTCFVGDRLPSFAVGGEKDKKDKKADDKDKKDKKDETKDKKTDDKDKKDKKDETKDKKDETKDKKGEDKKPTAGGVAFKFTAFDENAKPFYQTIVTETTQNMKVMNQEVVQKQSQTFHIKWTPKKKDSKSNYVVEQKIIGVEMNIDIGGNKISFKSSEEKQAKNPMTDFFTTLMSKELTFHIKPDMTVDEIDGRKEFVKALTDTNPAITSLLNTILSEDALKKMAEPTWYAIPDKAVNVGDTWKKASTLKLGPIGEYHTDFTFTYKGKKDNNEQIDISASMTYKAPNEKAGLPFVITKADLKSKKGSGEAIFDPAKGRIASSKITMEIAGELTIEVGNMPTVITLDQNQTSTVTTSDDDPTAKKK